MTVIDEASFPTLGTELVLVRGVHPTTPGWYTFTVELRRGTETLVAWRSDTGQARKFFADVRTTMSILEAIEKMKMASH